MKSVIVPEDFLLEKIVKKLVWHPEVRIDRAGSLTKVFRVMHTNLHNDRAVGVIDNDKIITVPDFALFREEIANESNVIVKRSVQRPLHSLVILHKASEEWLWYAAESVNVSPESFGLGRTLEEFCTHTKGEVNAKKPEIAEFLGVVARLQPPAFTVLKQWLMKEITRIA